jgi:hypothetical protein
LRAQLRSLFFFARVVQSAPAHFCNTGFSLSQPFLNLHAKCHRLKPVLLKAIRDK